MNKSPLLVKITYILVSTSHAKCWPFKYWWSALNNKVCKKIPVRPWWRSYARVHARLCVCVCDSFLHLWILIINTINKVLCIRSILISVKILTKEWWNVQELTSILQMVKTPFQTDINGDQYSIFHYFLIVQGNCIKILKHSSNNEAGIKKMRDHHFYRIRLIKIM